MLSKISCLLIASLALGAPSVKKISRYKSQVVISHPDATVWRPGDSACILHEKVRVGCGTVAHVSPKGAILDFGRPNLLVAEGDAVEKNEIPRPVPPIHRSFELSGGVYSSTTLDIVFPTVGFRRQLFGGLAIGLAPAGFYGSAANSSVFAFGSFLTFHFFSDGHFGGLWLQGGPGYFWYEARMGTVRESKNGLAALATIGWRHSFGSRFSVGGAVGAQYLLDPGLATISIDATGTKPLALLDMGVSF